MIFTASLHKKYIKAKKKAGCDEIASRFSLWTGYPTPERKDGKTPETLSPDPCQRE